MPRLPDTYVDHLVAPRHGGDLEDAHAAGEFGSMIGGLGVRITLAFGGDGRRPEIVRARGRAFGSPAPVPALSWLTEALRGRTADEALEIQADDVLGALVEGNGFEPPARVRFGTEYAIQALHSALGDPAAPPPADPGGKGILVCRCLGVGDREIRAAIRAGATDPDVIGDVCRACTGCRTCRGDLLALIEEELRPVPELPAGGHPVARIALVHAGRQLRSLGLPLEDAVVEGDVLRIRLGEAREDALATPISAVAITRHVLREVVWDDARVELL